MKKHANIPIFLPHKGCQNNCVFCNQKIITAKLSPLKTEEVIETIETYLSTLLKKNMKTIEIAFFGGSFTGIPIEDQKQYLKIAKSYKDRGLIQRIRLSTRPDYINEDILNHLKAYDVSTIELGVQSFDDEVLRLSKRGHSSEIVYKSSELIKSYGFELGVQLMIGLPGDTFERSITSAKKTVDIAPAVARLYPTIVLKDTELERMFLAGRYKPLNIDTAVHTTKHMYLILKNAGINVIRIGLKSTSQVGEGDKVIAGDYHPAFRQLVEGNIIKDKLESQLKGDYQKAVFYSHSKSFSDMIGNKKRNEIYFKKSYKDKKFEFKMDDTLKEGDIKVELF